MGNGVRFSVAETQTSDASHSTTNGWLSSVDWSVALSLSSSFFSRSKTDRADSSSGKDVAFTRGGILLEKFGIHVAKQTCPPLYGESRHVLEEDSLGGGEVALDLV